MGSNFTPLTPQRRDITKVELYILLKNDGHKVGQPIKPKRGTQKPTYIPILVATLDHQEHRHQHNPISRHSDL